MLALASSASAGDAPCTVRPAGSGLELVVHDLDTTFPEISTKLAKGLAVTILSTARLGDETFAFGCKIYLDLWAEAYVVKDLSGGAERSVNDKSAAFETCRRARIPWSAAKGEIRVSTDVDPISQEQEEKTREWLAEKGIGGNSKALFGRAAATLTNFHKTQKTNRTCEVLP